MHTEHTLGAMEKATSAIGYELRSFQDLTHSAFVIKELPSKTSAQGWRKQKKQLKSAGCTSQTRMATTINSDMLPLSAPAPPVPSPKVKKLNLFTYKLHALGDYVCMICLFGTTDSYSTQIVCHLSQRQNHADVLSRENLLII
jgi:hypothetical protein